VVIGRIGKGYLLGACCCHKKFLFCVDEQYLR
jgi:hypothetical protein